MDVDGLTLRAWADVARVGERRIYFVGRLAGTRNTERLAAVARELERAGLVTLFQARIQEDVYAYVAQRRADRDRP